MSGAWIGGGGLTSPVGVADGGTGRATLTDGAVLVGDGTNPVELIGPLTDGQLLIGNTAGVSPTISTLTGGTGLSVVNGAGSITVNLDTPVSVANGGTGRATLTDGSILVGDGTTAVELVGPLTDGQLLIGDTAGVSPATTTLTAGNNITITNGAGSITVAVSEIAIKEYWFAAEGLQPLETDFAALEKLAGGTVNVFVRAFANATAEQEEYANGKLQVPGDVDTSGTVTFRAYVMAKTAAASKNVALTFGHIPLNDSEDFDVAYTDEDSGDNAIDATQDDLTEITWTETISNLSWAANDIVLFRISRPAASANDLAGDMYMFSLAVEIPRI